MQETEETCVWSLGQEDPLEEGMAAHSSIVAWRIPMDREIWWATVHRVAKHRTWLKRLSMHTQCKGRDLWENKRLHSRMVGGVIGIHWGCRGGTYLLEEGSRKRLPEEMLRELTSNLRPTGQGAVSQVKGRERAFQAEGSVGISLQHKDAHSPVVERKSICVMRNDRVMGKKGRGEQIIKVIRGLELSLRAVWSLRRAFSIKALRTKGRKTLPGEAYFQQRHCLRGCGGDSGTCPLWFLVHPTPKEAWVPQKASCCPSYRPFLMGTIQGQGEVPHRHVRVFTRYLLKLKLKLTQIKSQFFSQLHEPHFKCSVATSV